MSNQKVALFIDGANFYHAQREMGWWVDPKKLMEWVGQNYGNVNSATYYLGEDDNDSHNRYMKALSRMGYSVFAKPVRFYDTETTQRKPRIDLDIEIVHDILTTKDQFDVCVLVSGSSNFRRTLETLKTLGKTFVVISTESFVAEQLRRVAGRNFVDFDSIKDNIERVRVPRHADYTIRRGMDMLDEDDLKDEQITKPERGMVTFVDEPPQEKKS